jgi:hypothetical protein
MMASINTAGERLDRTIQLPRYTDVDVVVDP